MGKEAAIMSNGTALAVVAPSSVTNATTQLEPSTAEQAFWLASQLVKSGLLGKNINKPEAAFAIILAGRELGLTAMQSLRSIHIIEGKPTLSSDLMVALVKRSPTCRSFKLVESTNDSATYETDRIGEGVTRMSFTIEDAKLAGLAGKDNFRKYPAAMLRARCIAALARVVYPDVLVGIYEENELSAESSMPAAREFADTPIAPVIVRPAPESAPADAVDDEVAEFWGERFAKAQTAEEVAALATECKAEVTDRPTLLVISTYVNAAKARVEAK